MVILSPLDEDMFILSPLNEDKVISYSHTPVIRITFSHIPPLFLWSCVAQSLAFCVLLWGPLLVCLFFFFQLLYFLYFINLQFQITSLVSSKFSCNNQMLKYWGKSFKIFSSHVSRSCWIKQYFFILWVWTTLGNKFSLLLNECKKLCRQCGIFCFSFYWYLDKC